MLVVGEVTGAIVPNPLSSMPRQRATDNESPEVELIHRIAVGHFDLPLDDPRYPALVNYYVALRSKPIAVLVGPGGSGKEALASRVADAIVGRRAEKHQVLAGHPWWAREKVGATAHARWNELKLDALIAEATQPKNARRAYFVCLQHISPAELDEVAVSAAQPYPLLPPNLFIAATFDRDRPLAGDDELLSVASVIWWPWDWPPAANGREPRPVAPAAERIFVKSSLRRASAARRRLRQVFGDITPPVRALVEVTAPLAKADIRLGPTAMDDAIRYLANAWSAEGVGLFDPQPSRNLTIALDFAIAQALVTRAMSCIGDRPAAGDMLGAILRDRYPHSAALLAAIQA